MYSTEHSRLRFMQRVKNVNLPKRNKVKFIEHYFKKAFKEGLTPKEIDNDYLRDYMNGKLKHDIHYLNATKITHYKNNLFLFNGHTCITVLEMPEKAQDCIDDIIYITKLKTYINHLKEKQNVKNWLLDNGRDLEKIKDIKRCNINVPKDLSYTYLINNFPLNCAKYIKNDSKFKEVIIKNNKKRKSKIKEVYYKISALLLLLPKNQILKLQQKLANNKNSIFCVINKNGITKKQLEICYKQLFILLNGNITPKYNEFNVNDNSCYDLINDYLINIIDDYTKNVKQFFKDKSERMSK